MTIAIVSAQYPCERFSDITRIIARDYARKHGYDFYYFQEPVPSDPKGGTWSIYYTKIAYLLKVMNYQKHDIVVWLDADVFICDVDKPLEQVADLKDSSIDLHICKDPPQWSSPICTGIFMMLNRPEMRNAMELTYEARYLPQFQKWPPEQSALYHYMKGRIKTKIYNSRKFNSHPLTNYRKGDFLMHMAGMSSTDRYACIMNSFNPI
jgi:hypothetical protein